MYGALQRVFDGQCVSGVACLELYAIALNDSGLAGFHYAQRMQPSPLKPCREGLAWPQSCTRFGPAPFLHTVLLLSKDGVRTNLGGRRASHLCWQADSPCCSPGGWKFRPQDKPHCLCTFLVRWRPDAPVISQAYSWQYLLSPRCLLQCMRSLQLMQIVRQLF